MDELKAKLQTDIHKRNLPQLLKRNFIKVGDDDDHRTIRVMQWNILAQALTTGDDNFILCPPEALKWDNRQFRVIEEMVRFNPTILCLQEVDIFDYLKKSLGDVGYEGIFCPKPDSPCLYFPNNTGSDGCAIFYRADQVELVKEDKITLQKNDGEETNQVSILCKFKTKDHNNGTGSVFYVSVCHLKAKSGYENLRHEQGKYLLKVLSERVGNHPFVICGDFNASPSELVYAEFVNSELGMASAYSLLSPERKEPEYTTWKIRGTSSGGRSESCKTIDYIWYSLDKARVTSLLSIPASEEIGKERLPCYLYPSDHFALVCDLDLLK